MTCAHCRELEATIADLERALDGAIWPNDAEAKRLMCGLPLSMQQAHLVLALYKSEPGLTNIQLSEYLPLSDGLMDRDPTYASVIVHHVRKKLGDGFIQGLRSSRAAKQVYALPLTSRHLVAAILGSP